MNRRGWLSTFALVTAAWPALAQDTVAPGAASADDGSAVRDIVVTAQRRAESLQKVPITVTAVSADQLAAAGVISTADLTTTVSGLSVGTTAAYFSPRIRGIGTSFFGAGVETPVALYVDDIYYASGLMAPTDLSDIQQVAVLKGPQGTLFGRNSTGGVIQMTSRQPKDQIGGEINTELDNYLTSRNRFYITGPIADKLNANLYVRYTTQGSGWGDNLFTGTEIHRIIYDFAVRNNWEWQPTDTTTIRLGVDYTRHKDNLGQNYRLAFHQPQGVTGVLPGLGTTEQSDNPYDVSENVDNYNKFEGGGGSVRIEQDIGFGQLISITGYRKFRYESLSDADGSPVPLFDVFEIQKSHQFSQELQLASRKDSRLTWLVGGYYFKARDNLADLNVRLQDADAFSLNPEATASIPFFTNYSFLGGSSSVFHYQNLARTESYAVFGQATAEVFEGTRLTGGIRYTHDKRSIVGTTTGIIEDFGISFPTATGDQSFKEGKVTWRAAIDHDFGKDLLGYASYNRGYKSGGYNAASDANAPPYKSETVDSYELGLKSELFDRRLRLNPALFYSKYKNVQVAVYNNITAIFANASGSRIYGVDLDGEWRAARNLNFTFGLEWLHAKYLDFPGVPYFDTIPGGGIVIGTAPRNGKGNRPSFAPKLTFNLGANYHMPVRGGSFDLSAIDAYNSGYFTESDNAARQQSFHMLNTSLTFTTLNKRFSLGVFVRNVLNELVAGQIVGTAPVGFLADYNVPPRTFGMNATFRFGQ